MSRGCAHVTHMGKYEVCKYHVYLAVYCAWFCCVKSIPSGVLCYVSACSFRSVWHNMCTRLYPHSLMKVMCAVVYCNLLKIRPPSKTSPHPSLGERYFKGSLLLESTLTPLNSYTVKWSICEEVLGTSGSVFTIASERECKDARECVGAPSKSHSYGNCGCNRIVMSSHYTKVFVILKWIMHMYQYNFVVCYSCITMCTVASDGGKRRNM